MKRTTVSGLFFFAMLLAGATPAPAADILWQEPGCARRIALHFPAVAGGPVTAGMVLTGKELYRWTGFPCPAVRSLRLQGTAGPVAVQVAEYDGGEMPLPQGNGRLDDNDRLFFVVHLGPEPLILHLYYDGPAVAEPAAPASATEVQEKPGALVPLILKSGALTVGLRGGGAPPFDNKQTNHGRGTLAMVEWQGQTLTDMRGNWGRNFPRTTGTGPGAPAWTEPKIIAAGPVCTVVEIRCEGYADADAGKGISGACITRHIAVWRDCPAIDWEEVVEYSATAYERDWGYAHDLPVGKKIDLADRLYVTLAGAAQAVPIIRDLAERTDNPWKGIYNAEVPEEGWLALADSGEATGLALFYEKMDTIAFRNAWVAYRPALHPRLHLRTTPHDTMELTLTFRDRALRCRPSYSRQLRYLGLRGEVPETVRTLYRLWGDVASVLTVDPPEKR